MASNPTYRILVKHDWEPTFLWWPRKVSNRIRWLTSVYRRQVLVVDGNRNGFVHEYEYGTFFDVLNNADK